MHSGIAILFQEAKPVLGLFFAFIRTQLVEVII